MVQQPAATTNNTMHLPRAIVAFSTVLRKFRFAGFWEAAKAEMGRFPVGGSEAVLGASPTAEQAELIRALRAAVVDSPEFRAHEAEAGAYISDDRLLHRFLQARKYSLPKAGEMLRRHLTWRFETYRPFDIRCVEMEPYARTGSIQASFALSLTSVTPPATM